MSTEENQGSIYSAPESDTSTTGADDLLAVYVGPQRAEYYKARFDKLASGGSIGWHWPAFFFSSAWLLYRKMWLYALLYIIVVPTILSVVTMLVFGAAVGTMIYYTAYVVYGFILMPLFANRLYYGHAKAKIDKISSLNMSEAQVVQELARKGGTSWLGFIFVIIPIIGILAAITIPAYQDYTSRAQVSEGLSLANGAKAAVVEYYNNNQVLPADNEAAGLAAPASINGNYTESVEVADGDIIVTYGGEATYVIGGGTLVLRPDIDAQGTVDWICFSPDLAPKHLPAACR